MKESAIQGNGRKKLEAAGWYVIKLIKTTKNGIPDHLALRSGRAVFIEWKRPGETPDPLQVRRHEELRNHGFEVVVAWSEEQIKHLY